VWSIFQGSAKFSIEIAFIVSFQEISFTGMVGIPAIFSPDFPQIEQNFAGFIEICIFPKFLHPFQYF
jgi:hypothetical protein